MKIPVRSCLDLQGQTLPLHETYSFAGLKERNEHLLEVEKVEFHGEGRLESGIFTVTGEITGNYKLSCSRCLNRIPVQFSQPFEERFNIDAHMTREDEHELEEIHEVEGNLIDLTPHIEEEVLLSIPFAPVCASVEKCAANIPQKGENWSVATEKEETDKIDPRLAKLARFYDHH